MSYSEIGLKLGFLVPDRQVAETTVHYALTVTNLEKWLSCIQQTKWNCNSNSSCIMVWNFVIHDIPPPPLDTTASIVVTCVSYRRSEANSVRQEPYFTTKLLVSNHHHHVYMHVSHDHLI